MLLTLGLENAISPQDMCVSIDSDTMGLNIYSVEVYKWINYLVPSA
jgi:hypothetical protein